MLKGRRRGWLALVAALGAVAIALTVLPRQGGGRGAAALLLLPGLAAGVAAGLVTSTRPAVAAWLRASRPRTGPERANDIAFLVVLVGVWAVATALLGRWSGLLTGAVVGFALAVASRLEAAGGSR